MLGDTDLSEFIIVGVDIVKTLDHVSRGPQDPAGVDRVKQLHGDFGARHRLHVDRHQRLVWKETNTQTDGDVRNIPPTFNCQYCPADEISFLP